MPLLSGSLTELAVLTHLREPVPFLMKFNVMIFLLEEWIGPLSTTLLQSEYTFCTNIGIFKNFFCATSYEVQCNDLPSGGVDRTTVNNLAVK